MCRFHLRSLMALVAIVGVGLATWIALHRRRDSYLRLSHFHAQREYYAAAIARAAIAQVESPRSSRATLAQVASRWGPGTEDAKRLKRLTSSWQSEFDELVEQEEGNPNRLGTRKTILRLDAEVTRLLNQARYYRRLRWKYTHAAARPWLPVPPDPPEP